MLQLSAPITGQILAIAKTVFKQCWDILPIFGATFWFVDNAALIQRRNVVVSAKKQKVMPDQRIQEKDHRFTRALNFSFFTVDE
jgi:hypothetical protein